MVQVVALGEYSGCEGYTVQRISKSNGNVLPEKEKIMAYRGHIPYDPATDPKALFTQGLKNYLGGLNQQRESKRFGQALGEINPEATLFQAIAQMLSGGATPQQAMGVGGMMQRGGISPSQQIAQKKLNRINMLQEKIETGTATTGEKAALDKMLEGTPLVQFGKDWEADILGPKAMADRVKKKHKEAMAEKPMSETERKGVISVIEQVVGESKAMPFGVRPGPALKQADMEKLWEDVMEATGYGGRLSTQQTQIEQAFDQYVSTLNKGVGAGVLANQYQWDRKKYKGLKATTKKDESPYEDYPDAFQEDGVWKVMRDGKKYRIEE